MTRSESTPEIMEQPARTGRARRDTTVGLPAPPAGCDERRFPLTPEAAAMLCGRGYTVKIESGAGKPIHYSDQAYTRAGAAVVDRREALACDIVISLSAPTPADIRAMRRGAMLLTLIHPLLAQPATATALLKSNILAIALDLIEDSRGNTPFADILSEVDGIAAVTIAASILADPVAGKGILLGGVAGVVPCEATVLGSGIAARAAAAAAAGMGCVVSMFDNDIYRLRDALHYLGDRATGSALHPKVLANALRSADIVVVTQMDSPTVIDSGSVSEMKKGVIVFDLTATPGEVFPSLQPVAASAAGDTSARRCLTDTGNRTPRTASMALSNSLITLFADISSCEGAGNALKLLPGIQKAALTFMGNAVNPAFANAAGVRSKDLGIFLTLS